MKASPKSSELIASAMRLGDIFQFEARILVKEECYRSWIRFPIPVAPRPRDWQKSAIDCLVFDLKNQLASAPTMNRKNRPQF